MKFDILYVNIITIGGLMSRRRSGYNDNKFSGKYLGPRIREYRMARGMSVVKLAKEVGILPNYISQLESGDKLPSLDTFIRIANALNVTADELLCDYLVAELQVVESKLNTNVCNIHNIDKLPPTQTKEK